MAKPAYRKRRPRSKLRRQSKQHDENSAGKGSAKRASKPPKKHSAKKASSKPPKGKGPKRPPTAAKPNTTPPPSGYGGGGGGGGGRDDSQDNGSVRPIGGGHTADGGGNIKPGGGGNQNYGSGGSAYDYGSAPGTQSYTSSGASSPAPSTKFSSAERKYFRARRKAKEIRQNLSEIQHDLEKAQDKREKADLREERKDELERLKKPDKPESLVRRETRKQVAATGLVRGVKDVRKQITQGAKNVEKTQEKRKLIREVKVAEKIGELSAKRPGEKVPHLKQTARGEVQRESAAAKEERRLDRARAEQKQLTKKRRQNIKGANKELRQAAKVEYVAEHTQAMVHNFKQSYGRKPKDVERKSIRRHAIKQLKANLNSNSDLAHDLERNKRQLKVLGAVQEEGKKRFGTRLDQLLESDSGASKRQRKLAQRLAYGPKREKTVMKTTTEYHKNKDGEVVKRKVKVPTTVKRKIKGAEPDWKTEGARGRSLGRLRTYGRHEEPKISTHGQEQARIGARTQAAWERAVAEANQSPWENFVGFGENLKNELSQMPEGMLMQAGAVANYAKSFATQNPEDREQVYKLMKQYLKSDPAIGAAGVLLHGGSLGDAWNEARVRGYESPSSLIADLSAGYAGVARVMRAGRIAPTARPSYRIKAEADVVEGPKRFKGVRDAHQRRNAYADNFQARRDRLKAADAKAKERANRSKKPGEDPSVTKGRERRLQDHYRDRVHQVFEERMGPDQVGESQSYSGVGAFRPIQKAREDAQAFRGKDPFVRSGKKGFKAAGRKVAARFRGERAASMAGEKAQAAARSVAESDASVEAQLSTDAREIMDNPDAGWGIAAESAGRRASSAGKVAFKTTRESVRRYFRSPREAGMRSAAIWAHFGGLIDDIPTAQALTALRDQARKDGNIANADAWDGLLEDLKANPGDALIDSPGVRAAAEVERQFNVETEPRGLTDEQAAWRTTAQRYRMRGEAVDIYPGEKPVYDPDSEELIGIKTKQGAIRSPDSPGDRGKVPVGEFDDLSSEWVIPKEEVDSLSEEAIISKLREIKFRISGEGSISRTPGVGMRWSRENPNPDVSGPEARGYAEEQRLKRGESAVPEMPPRHGDSSPHIPLDREGNAIKPEERITRRQLQDRGSAEKFKPRVVKPRYDALPAEVRSVDSLNAAHTFYRVMDALRGSDDPFLALRSWYEQNWAKVVADQARRKGRAGDTLAAAIGKGMAYWERRVKQLEGLNPIEIEEALTTMRHEANDQILDAVNAEIRRREAKQLGNSVTKSLEPGQNRWKAIVAHGIRDAEIEAKNGVPGAAERVKALKAEWDLVENWPRDAKSIPAEILDHEKFLHDAVQEIASNFRAFEKAGRVEEMEVARAEGKTMADALRKVREEIGNLEAGVMPEPVASKLPETQKLIEQNRPRTQADLGGVRVEKATGADESHLSRPKPSTAPLASSVTRKPRAPSNLERIPRVGDKPEPQSSGAGKLAARYAPRDAKSAPGRRQPPKGEKAAAATDRGTEAGKPIEGPTAKAFGLVKRQMEVDDNGKLRVFVTAEPNNYGMIAGPLEGLNRELGLSQKDIASMVSTERLVELDLTKNDVRATNAQRFAWSGWQQMQDVIRQLGYQGGRPLTDWQAQLQRLRDAGEDWVALDHDQIRTENSILLDNTGFVLAKPDAESAFLLPRSVVKVAQEHLRKQGPLEAVLHVPARAFVAAVLPFSVGWHAGNILDLATRLAVWGASLTEDPKLFRQFYREYSHVAGKERADAFVVNIAGHYGSQEKVLAAERGAVSEAFSKVKVAQGARGALKSFEDSLPAGVRQSAKEVKDLGTLPYRGVKAASQKGFDMAAVFERPLVQAGGGLALRRLARELGLDVGDHMQIAREMAHAADFDHSLMDAFGRKAVEIIGDYSMSPWARRWIAPIDPFFRWVVEANKFIFYHFPAKHPVKFALAMQAGAMGEEMAKSLGLDDYLEGIGMFGIQLAGAGFLAGGIPVGDGYFRPTSPFTSWGESSKMIEDPIKYIGERVFPYFQQASAAAAGFSANQKGGELLVKGIEGQLADWFPEKTQHLRELGVPWAMEGNRDAINRAQREGSTALGIRDALGEQLRARLQPGGLDRPRGRGAGEHELELADHRSGRYPGAAAREQGAEPVREVAGAARGSRRGGRRLLGDGIGPGAGPRPHPADEREHGPLPGERRHHPKPGRSLPQRVGQDHAQEGEGDQG